MKWQVKEKSDFIEYLKSSNTEECIIWPFPKNSSGYGNYRIGKRQFGAHVAVNMIINGGEGNLTRHLCGNGKIGCVNPKHLKWGNHKENFEDAILHGSASLGERHSISKLKEREVIDIFNRVHNGEKVRNLSKEFNCHRGTIYAIKYRRSWKSVTEKISC